MTENQFRDINFMNLVYLYRYGFAIIKNSDFIFLDSNIYFGHFLVSLIIVSSVYEYLIEYLVKPRNIFYLSIDEFFVLHNPHYLLSLSYRANVHVWTHQYMLYLADFLVSLFNTCLHGANS